MTADFLESVLSEPPGEGLAASEKLSAPMRPNRREPFTAAYFTTNSTNQSNIFPYCWLSQ